MLSRVLDLVAQRGWFDVSRPFDTSVHLTQGACLWLMLTRKGVCDSYVKFSDCASLEREAQRCAAASRCYPTLVPRFVGFLHEDGLDLLVCKAVDYRGLSAKSLRHARVRGRVFDDLQGYFVAMPGTRLPQELTPDRNADLAVSLAAYFATHELAPQARRWLRSEALRRATQLPEMPQHGDFMPNNIGQQHDGSVVVFDWEDFGASCLPGLDLFTLELALAGDAAGLVSGRADHTHPTQQFFRRACQAMQLDFGDYTSLAMVYALVFRHLKRNYGPEVRERMDRLLLDMDRQPSFGAA